ncbi:hypothetical protein F4809DRAFT_646623 [Biscogniauxia mediterranea]|nr:hypothetical protein F4809DRAFT_646623 [Biscogniauxia mediterranea]
MPLSLSLLPPPPPAPLLHITLVNAHTRAPLSTAHVEQRRRRSPPPGRRARYPRAERHGRVRGADRIVVAEAAHAHPLGPGVPSSRPGSRSGRTSGSAVADVDSATPFFAPCAHSAYTFPADDDVNSYGRCQNGHITC